MFGRKKDLDAPLLRLTPWDNFTLRDACQGVLVTGGIGSGKTSGSGAALAKAYLKAGMGGLVLCAKPEEVALWRRYCAATGRAAHLIVWDGSTYGFNFIAYELARQGEAFWDDTMRQVLRSTIPVLFAAYGTVRISDILQCLRSAPRTPQEMADPGWQAGSFFCRCFTQAAPKLSDETGERLIAYWRNDFATLDSKTRGNIVISLTTALDRFNHGWLREAFCGETNLVPELTFNGAIILLAMPALTRNEDGIIAQQLFKYMWQRAVLARNGLPPSYQQRPVFLWADEAQYFINSFDAEYLSTCRGSRACTVFLSQSLPTFYAKMGGEGSHDRVHHLLGNFATRIWHNNACAETNEWAARTLGRKLHTRQNWSESHGRNSSYGMNAGEGSNWGTSSQSGGSSSSGNSGHSTGSSWGGGSSAGGSDNWGRNRGHGSSSNSSHGYSEQMDYVLEPGAFSRGLITGGPANRNRVSAVWYQAGRRWNATATNAMLLEFRQ